jgi:hemerythrin-like domain-containing protein
MLAGASDLLSRLGWGAMPLHHFPIGVATKPAACATFRGGGSRERQHDRRERGDEMDALKLLKQDHDEVKSMLSDLESTTERAEKTRTSGLATLKAELEVHEAIEEEIFYPALKEHPKTKDLALEGYEEHHVVDMVMAEIEGVEPSDETWMAKFTVMKENLEHHIEEEEGEMFGQAEQVFDDDELEELGERMRARKDELKAASPA